jgi:alkylhydroperoxidase family enzyme
MRWEPMPSARTLAPTAFKDWEVLTNEASVALDAALLALIQDRIDVILGHATSVQPPISDTERSCTEAIEQFIIDVASLTDAQRDGVFAAMGSRSYPFFQTLYVRDFDFRFRAALTQLFGEPASAAAAPDPGQTPGSEPPDLWPALDRFLTDVASMDALDPVTTELIRLRGARAHNCRICQSRREIAAINGGADEGTFDKIDFYETSDLDERSKVALRLTDALLWQPAAYPDGLVEQVRATFSPDETIEIVLDLVRNAANKVAVALQADQAVVAVGVEYFSVGRDGALSYGLPAPVGASGRG